MISSILNLAAVSLNVTLLLTGHEPAALYVGLIVMNAFVAGCCLP